MFTHSAFAEVRIQLWHSQMYAHRKVLADLGREFETANPGVKVDILYRETEELRSAYQSAVMGGSGPDLIYGPSDQVGPMSTMGIIAPLEKIFTPDELAEFHQLALINYRDHLYMIGDRIGNFLMLIYNKKLLKEPPKTVEELTATAKKLTVDIDGDGRTDQFGLAFNFTEPYFFVPWIGGFGESFLSADGHPNLATKATVDAFTLIRDWKLKDRIIPSECDYEMANSLFKQGRAAMVINGDWSWGDYLEAKIDFGIAPLPQVKATGRWPTPLVGTTGYSLNPNLEKDRRDTAIRFLRFMLSSHAQEKFTQAVSTFPSLLRLQDSEAVKSNPILRDAVPIMARGQQMSVAPELRAVWDSLRREYQSVLGGVTEPEEASRRAQADSLAQIDRMNETLAPDGTRWIVLAVLIGLLGYLLFHSIKGIKAIRSARTGSLKFAYLMTLPAVIALFLVVVYPFVFNILLSFSNFSLMTFRDWKIVGMQHYISAVSDWSFYGLLLKTMIWTFTNVFMHMVLGVGLALIINQTLPAKPLWRTLLIVPWAVPQYITALTWRGMFNREYGPINQFLADFLSLPPLDWLSDPLLAFTACFITNVWLGFPFMMVVALGGLQTIPHDLHEAARVDGVSAYRRFWLITWPLLLPVLKPAAVLGCIWTFNSLGVIWLVSNGGEPADQTHILVTYIYRAAFNLYRYGHAAALSVLTFLLLFLLARVMTRKEEVIK
jgi:arabinogalactan oligomer/maltooligosaccharide transport system permease protein